MNHFIEHLELWQFDTVISPLKEFSVHQRVYWVGFFCNDHKHKQKESSFMRKTSCLLRLCHQIIFCVHVDWTSKRSRNCAKHSGFAVKVLAAVKSFNDALWFSIRSWPVRPHGLSVLDLWPLSWQLSSPSWRHKSRFSTLKPRVPKASFASV